MGGSNKIQDYSLLSDIIQKSVKLLILVGSNSLIIKSQLGVSIDTRIANSFVEAVNIAKNFAKKHDSVILSPASPSFDQFRDYQHRGAVFKQAVLDFAD